MLLIAVSDDAIPAIAETLAAAATSEGFQASIVLHTSGSAGPGALDALRHIGIATGVLHPLQTIPSAEAGYAALPGSTVAYAGDALACDQAVDLIRLVRGKPLAINPAGWSLYHVAAVMASNYQAALVDAALELMESADVPRVEALSALSPLIAQTMSNILQMGTDAALTGPIRRGDLGTVQRHVNALRTVSRSVAGLYAAAGRQTLVIAARAGVDSAKLQTIESALSQTAQG